MKIKKILPFVATAAIMALIFFFSAQDAQESSKVSRTVTEKVVEMKNKDATQAEKTKMVKQMNSKVRKAAHFTLYALLGISTFEMFCIIFPNKGYAKRMLWAVVLCCVYACSDEVHQFFSDGRAPMLTDVGIDTLGAICGGGLNVGICIMINNIRKKRGNKSD